MASTNPNQKAIKIDHKKKTITVNRKLNPRKFHAWMLSKAVSMNPEYTVIDKEINDDTN